MHGKDGTLRTAEGFLYKGDFMDGKYHGEGTMVQPDGRIYKGEWAFGKQEGFGVQTLKCGKPVQGQWRQGKRITWVEGIKTEEEEGHGKEDGHKCDEFNDID
jgi:hypothetical protein